MGRLLLLVNLDRCVLRALLRVHAYAEPSVKKGATVGELDVITSAPRRNTLHAIRDTELIRMPLTLFNAISARNPGTTAQ